MDIKSFEVWNFKSIEYSGEISFPKLTVLIGQNSAGKSSIAQSLLLMKQTFEAEEPSIPLVLNGPYTQLGEYKDFIHGKDDSLPFIIKFNFETSKKDKPYACEVCGSEYKVEGWFLKHVRNNHKKFWKKNRERISTSEYHLPKKSSLKFQYAFDFETSSIILQELEIENPNSIWPNGLSLNSIKIRQEKDNKIIIEAISNNKKKIFSKSYNTPTDTGVIDHNLMVRLFDYSTSVYFRLRSTLIGNEEIALIEDDLGSEIDDETLKEFLSPSNSQTYYRQTKMRELIKRYNSLNKPQRLAINLVMRLNSFDKFLINRLDNVKNFCQAVRHVGPLRNWPERIYLSTGGKPTSVGERGQFTQDIFWRDKKIGHESLIRDINVWLTKLKLGYELEVVPLGVGEIYQIRLKENGLSVNLADVGFGISQVLPILTECINFSIRDIPPKISLKPRYFFYEKEEEEVNRLLISEQPEIHLNPRIQAELGDFFIQLGKKNRVILIETHSEHIITRIQRRVADGTLNSEDVIIYFISKHDNKSEVKEISISNVGQFSYWPEGFFQDDFEDAIEILKESLRPQGEK